MPNNTDHPSWIQHNPCSRARFLPAVVREELHQAVAFVVESHQPLSPLQNGRLPVWNGDDDFSMESDREFVILVTREPPPTRFNTPDQDARVCVNKDNRDGVKGIADHGSDAISFEGLNSSSAKPFLYDNGEHLEILAPKTYVPPPAKPTNGGNPGGNGNETLTAAVYRPDYGTEKLSANRYAQQTGTISCVSDEIRTRAVFGQDNAMQKPTHIEPLKNIPQPSLANKFKDSSAGVQHNAKYLAQYPDPYSSGNNADVSKLSQYSAIHRYHGPTNRDTSTSQDNLYASTMPSPANADGELMGRLDLNKRSSITQTFVLDGTLGCQFSASPTLETKYPNHGRTSHPRKRPEAICSTPDTMVVSKVDDILRASGSTRVDHEHLRDSSQVYALPTSYYQTGSFSHHNSSISLNGAVYLPGKPNVTPKVPKLPTGVYQRNSRQNNKSQALFEDFSQTPSERRRGDTKQPQPQADESAPDARYNNRTHFQNSDTPTRQKSGYRQGVASHDGIPVGYFDQGRSRVVEKQPMGGCEHSNKYLGYDDNENSYYNPSSNRTIGFGKAQSVCQSSDSPPLPFVGEHSRISKSNPLPPTSEKVEELHQSDNTNLFNPWDCLEKYHISPQISGATKVTIHSGSPAIQKPSMVRTIRKALSMSRLRPMAISKSLEFHPTLIISADGWAKPRYDQPLKGFSSDCKTFLSNVFSFIERPKDDREIDRENTRHQQEADQHNQEHRICLLWPAPCVLPCGAAQIFSDIYGMEFPNKLPSGYSLSDGLIVELQNGI